MPRGTVTFLFTDIEGSTALWERDPAAMFGALGVIEELSETLAVVDQPVARRTV